MCEFNKWFAEEFSDLQDAIDCGDVTAILYKKAIKQSYKAGRKSIQDKLQPYVNSIRHFNEIGEGRKIEYDLQSIEEVFIK